MATSGVPDSLDSESESQEHGPRFLSPRMTLAFPRNRRRPRRPEPMPNPANPVPPNQSSGSPGPDSDVLDAIAYLGAVVEELRAQVNQLRSDMMELQDRLSGILKSRRRLRVPGTSSKSDRSNAGTSTSTPK